MDRFHRYYKLHLLLSERRLPIPRSAIEKALECSRATAKRIIDDLRCYGAPIEYVRGKGYHYAEGDAFELPGVWFTPSELFALIAAHELLSQAEPGLLDSTLVPLRKRIGAMLSAEHLGDGELVGRVKLQRLAGRGVGAAFIPIVTALARRRQITIKYHSRDTDTVELRLISPQRLINYRDNWYLDAWCHKRRAPRRFSLERIEHVLMSEEPTHDVDQVELDEIFGATYGVFSGAATHQATIVFSAERARWVAEESWHPKQEGRFLEDGRYVLNVPYSDDRELTMDILRHGAHAEVIGPDALRATVMEQINFMLKNYS